MSENMLFPTVEVPELIQESEQYDEKYKPSVLWDLEAGDFVRNGANQLLECDGREAYRVWCVKVVNTERYTCLAYSDSIGTEMESAIKEKSSGAVESAIERTITEALLVNPRTEYVRGFVFTWNGDSVVCSFNVKGIEWEEFPLSVTVARCECGEEFFLEDRYYGCCQCPGCGRWYAIAGYEVNPPDEWEEDLEEDEW